ncbi:MAG: OmpA family protein [Planctomycetes bacterium]|nr:OmpA family protein [Planctomycetota bacterium]
MKHSLLFPHHRIALALGAVTLALLAAGCVSPEAHRRVVGANAALQAQIAQMVDSQKNLAVENDRLRGQIAELGKNAVDAKWVADQKERLADLLGKYGKDAPNAVPGVDLVQTPEGYAFRVAGEVLFSPGRNDLSDTGHRALDDLANALRGRRVRVEGHTDDTPIQHSSWGTNLRLSVERAMAVADYLTKSAGLDASKVGVAGYGEFRPAVAGNDEAARAKNRRVEILLLDG